MGELVIVGLILSPYLFLLLDELRDRLTDDGSRKYRLRARSTNPNLSEWEKLL